MVPFDLTNPAAFLRSSRCWVGVLVPVILFAGCSGKSTPSADGKKDDIAQHDASDRKGDASATKKGEGAQDKVRGVDPKTGLIDHAEATVQTASRPVTSIVFWPDGTKFATASGAVERRIEIWEAKNLQRLHGYPSKGDKRIEQLALSPDGKTLAATGDKVVELWDCDQQTLKKTLPGHTAGVVAVVYSSDGET